MKSLTSENHTAGIETIDRRKSTLSNQAAAVVEDVIPDNSALPLVLNAANVDSKTTFIKCAAPK